MKTHKIIIDILENNKKWKCFLCTCKLSNRLICESKCENNERISNWGTLLGS
jgi:hypothetical protein